MRKRKGRPKGRPKKKKKTPAAKSKSRKPANGATLGFESTLWQAADKLRNNMDAAEYKHVVLGLIFLKYISDAFEELHAKLEEAIRANLKGLLP